METTQKKVVAAAVVLGELGKKPMPSFAAYKLFKLRKALSPIVQFQSEQEIKLVGELGGTVTETGAILFEDTADKKRAELFAEYAEKHKELEELPCEIDLTGKVEMHMKEISEISMNDMETLSEFIEWKE